MFDSNEPNKCFIFAYCFRAVFPKLQLKLPAPCLPPPPPPLCKKKEKGK